MKILVISGFLGAGKTTFIKALAKSTGREFAVLENEYGSVGIDGDALGEAITNGKVNIWEMTEGCICCSTRGDFAASVLTIANTVDPEYLVVEPTGVGMLSNIVSNLRQIEYERIALLSPVTVVDGNSYERYHREYPRLYEDQVTTASVIIVSKMEQADDREKRRLEKSLRVLNPSADLWMEHYTGASRDQWMALLERGYGGIRIRVSEDRDSCLPDTFSMRNTPFESPEHLLVFLEDLVRGRYGNVIRAKGVVHAGEIIVRFDMADSSYSVIGENDLGEDKVVFIGTGIKRQEVRKSIFRRDNRGQ